MHSVLPGVECPRLSNGPLGEQDNSPRTGQARGALERLTARYEEITAGQTLHPPRVPANRAARGRVTNLLARLDTERDQVLPFAFDWRMPFDTNSEQAVRMAKVQQKGRLAASGQVRRGTAARRPALKRGLVGLK
jgi:hypothetical protein